MIPESGVQLPVQGLGLRADETQQLDAHGEAVLG